MDALRRPVFRRIYFGAFFSNIGSWMQNVVLGALAYDLTRSPTFVSYILFAQLGPMLLFSIPGGLLADTVDRRRLLVVISLTQALLALGLSYVVEASDPNKTLLLGVVFLMGTGQSVFAPTYSALLPDLVGPGNLAGAISLNSTQMNASRVIGPAIGGVLFAAHGAPVVFRLNAFTYLIVIAALLSVALPGNGQQEEKESPIRRLALGFRIARERHQVGRSLSVMVLFSFLCLPFIGQLPALADQNLGIAPDSTAYGMLYTSFGFGAMLGALSVGTTFSNVEMERLVRGGLVGFAVALGVFSLLRTPAAAYPVLAVVGFFYFGSVTSLTTVLQLSLASHERGRVMALWAMAFGGTVPIGNLVAGPLIEATSVTTVVLPGAVVGLLLAWWADLRQPVPSPAFGAKPED